MRQTSVTQALSSERLVRNIRRVTPKQYSAEYKIRIVLDGLRGESSIAELCRREGIAESLYYSWSKESGKRRLAADTARAATSSGHGPSAGGAAAEGSLRRANPEPALAQKNMLAGEA